MKQIKKASKNVNGDEYAVSLPAFKEASEPLKQNKNAICVKFCYNDSERSDRIPHGIVAV